MCGQNSKLNEHFTDMKVFNGDNTSLTHITLQGAISNPTNHHKSEVKHILPCLCCLPALQDILVVATNAEGMELKGSATEPPS